MARVIHHRPGNRPAAAQPASGQPPAALPFDYAASVPITGRPGATHEAVVNISPDGPFTAAAISYGFEQNRGQDFGGPAVSAPTPPGDLTLGAFPIDVLLDGLRVGPRYLPLVFETRPTAQGIESTGRFSPTPIGPDVLSATPVFERLQPPAAIEFFFTLIDSASGREFQDEPAFNISSLGDAAGRRPFRVLSAPVTFGPRSSLRVQVIERTPGVDGTLFLNLIGVQTTTQCAAAIAPPALDKRVIPFDYVSRVTLTGQPGNRLEDEVTVNVEGGFYVSNIGYGLQTDDPAVTLPAPAAPGGTIDLPNVRLRDLPPDTLIGGFRIAPGYVRFAVNAGGGLNPALPVEVKDRVFESVNVPESVSFRYSLFDTGAGRELQNQPIHNVAGLGSANGERPFKRLAVPLRFQPRSTFRLTVEEHFGRGELFFVLQGYKRLEVFAAGGRL